MKVECRYCGELVDKKDATILYDSNGNIEDIICKWC
jgi:hypothetical protein